jgi:hypothetical protein
MLTSNKVREPASEMCFYSVQENSATVVFVFSKVYCQTEVTS